MLDIESFCNKQNQHQLKLMLLLTPCPSSPQSCPIITTITNQFAEPFIPAARGQRKDIYNMISNMLRFSVRIQEWHDGR